MARGRGEVMPKPDSESDLHFERAAESLVQSTEVLLDAIESSLAEIQKIFGNLDSSAVPTQQKKARLVFRAVKEKLSEVEFFVKVVDQAIRNKDKR